MKESKDISYTLIGLVLIGAIFLISPIVYSIGFKGITFLLLTIIVVLYMLSFQKRTINVNVILLLLPILITASLSGIYWENLTITFYPLLFISSLFLVSLLSIEELTQVVSLGTKLLFIILFGALAAYIFSFMGFEKISQFQTSGGRLLDLYFFSLGENANVGSGNSYITLFRPAGIYDEPGALSMVVCLFAAMRHLLKMNRRVTWYLLILGFITFSLAHLIYVIIHWLAESDIKNKIKKLFIAIGVIVGISIISGASDSLVKGLVNRVIIFHDGEIILNASNNRTHHFSAAVAGLKERTIEQLLFGPDASCLYGGECKNGTLDFTPLSPMLIQGLFLSWYYYTVLIFLIFVGVTQQRNLVLVGVALLFMQRASMHSLGYSILIALIIILVIRTTIQKTIPLHNSEAKG